MFFGVPADRYAMSDGSPCIAIVLGMSNKDIIDMLDIDRTDESLVYSHIIRENGSYVIRSSEEISENLETQEPIDTYFKQIEYIFKRDGKPSGAQEHINELYEFVNGDATDGYVCRLDTGAHVLNLYCQKLERSEWFLVTIMQDDTLGDIIDSLSGEWHWWIFGACAAMLVVMIAVFCVYFVLNRQNVRRIEAAREEAIHANKAKSEFLSNMSHDIRTPMNAIVGMTAIACSDIDNRQHVQECLKKISLSSKHLLGLINDVLDMSKIESGKMTLNMEDVSLREVMDNISTIVQAQVKIKRQHFDVFIHDIITENVYCDSVRLNQILLNLLSNAIKFTQEEGDIEVSLYQEPSPLGDGHVRCHIRVKDNGMGMTPEFQKKIYDSFIREDNLRVHKTEGTGLGMAITKYIVDAMHGTIDLQSELGKGSEFHVMLELERAQTPEEEMKLPPWKMLVVDDDELLCSTVVSSLKDIGVEAEWTLDGESAVEKAQSAYKRSEGYDVILMDWKLPGIDGIETAKRLRELIGNETPILLMSAYDLSDMESEAHAAGISGFISKPLFKSTLFYGLRKFVAEEDSAEPEPENEPESSEPQFDGIRVLLAEDNDLNWEIVEDLLSGIGLICEHAENGKVCVDMFVASEPNAYKAILMDLRMPIMDGYEATVEIRKLDRPDKDLPIIAMSADAFSDDIKKCLDCGMNAHIAKPIDIDYVKSVLAKFIKN